MFDQEKWYEIFATMRKNKLRTALTALGVFWGIFMLVFLFGMGKGLENGVYKDFGSHAKNIMYVSAWRTSKPYKGFPSGRRIRLKLEDLQFIKNNVAGVARVAPRLNIGNQLIAHKDKNNSYEVRGELEDLINIESLKVYEGRYINQLDIEEARKIAIIGTKIKEVLFGEEDAIGKHILIGGIDFKVVGIFGPTQLKEWTRSDTESVVIPITTMYRAFGTGEVVDWFVCEAKPGIAVSSIEEDVRGILKERHQIDPEDKDAIQGFNLEEEFQQVQGLFFGIKSFILFVGLGSLLAGIVGVSNIMLITVKERTKEIGIRKALGATPGSIVNMIVTESIFITTISGYLGLLFGTVFIALINFIMVSNNIETENFYNPEISFFVGIGAIIILVISGTIAGLIPALHASKINPVEALKDE